MIFFYWLVLITLLYFHPMWVIAELTIMVEEGIRKTYEHESRIYDEGEIRFSRIGIVAN